MKQTVKKGKDAATKRSSVGALTPLTEAQQEMVSHNIPYAMNMGKRYAALGRFKGIPVEDLQQEACFGLCIAAQRYVAPADAAVGEGQAAGASFRTYAYNWCLKFIMMAINDEPLDTFEDRDPADVEIIDDDEEQALAEERAQQVEAMLAVLNPHERRVVSLLYGFEGESCDFRQIAAMMHIQVARVRQIYEKARTKMEFAAPL